MRMIYISDRQWEALCDQLNAVNHQLGNLIHVIGNQKEAILMATQAQIDKLLADIATLVTAAANEIAAAVAAQGAVDDPAVDAATTRLEGVIQNLNDTATALKGGQPIPPPVTPASP